MNRAFVTELPFVGKIPIDHDNLRTEFTWMVLADATHHNIHNYAGVHGYDEVYVIIPKGTFNLNVVGSKLSDTPNPVSRLLSQDFIATLRKANSRVYVVQEGPVWMHSDWSTVDQLNWHANLMAADGILCHNGFDAGYWKGLLGDDFPVVPIPTMMLAGLDFGEYPTERRDVLVGGNFSRWYGGYASLIVASEWRGEVYIPDSHSRRDDEDIINGVHHLPRLSWGDWMRRIKGFEAAVHLMPTAAAGSLSVNTGYWGIPTIGNVYMDTQNTIFPDLSVHPEDIQRARELMIRLRDDLGFYAYCSDYAKETVRDFIYTRDEGEKLFKELRELLDGNE